MKNNDLDRVSNSSPRGYCHSLIARWIQQGRFQMMPLEIQAWLRSLSDAAREMLVLDDEDPGELDPRGKWVNETLTTLGLQPSPTAKCWKSARWGMPASTSSTASKI